MAKYPYVASAGPIIKTVTHLRKSFPREVTADTLRKLGVAPKNESFVINVLRFLGVVDEEGKKVNAKANAFVQHEDEQFAQEFSKLVEESYEELFELHGEAAWDLDRNALTQFFRSADHSSDVVGTRQASTFEALAALSGHGEVPASKSGPGARKPSSVTKQSTRTRKTAKKQEKEKHSAGEAGIPPGSNQTVGLTVRVEVNLPAEGDQETYDAIFRSIRKNLIDGNIA